MSAKKEIMESLNEVRSTGKGLFKYILSCKVNVGMIAICGVVILAGVLFYTVWIF